MWLPYILLVVAVWACSSSVIFIKDSQVPPILISSYRLLLGSVLLSPVFFRDLKRYRDRFPLRRLRGAFFPGVVMALHFITWSVGARMTPAVNASLIVNMVPLTMPLFLWFMIKERVTRREGLGTLVAVGGVLFLAGFDFDISLVYFKGDLICFVSMLLFAWYLAFGRKNRDLPSVWLYVVPVYFVAGVTCFLLGLHFEDLTEGNYPWDFLMILGLAVFPTIIGHSSFNYCMRHLRGQTVSLGTVGQFITAGIMAYLHPRIREVPSGSFYLACFLVILGAVIALKDSPKD